MVPEPAKESRTRESGDVAIVKTRSISRVGFGVSNVTFPPKIDNKSFLASSVCPTLENIPYLGVSFLRVQMLWYFATAPVGHYLDFYIWSPFPLYEGVYLEST